MDVIGLTCAEILSGMGAPPPASSTGEIPVLEGRFELREVFSEAETGATFKAWDRQLKRLVLVKTLLPEILDSPEANRDLEEGVRRGLELIHPNIGLVYDCRAHEGIPYLVLEFVPGRDLDTYLFDQPDHVMDDATFQAVASQILDAVGHAHKAGIPHGFLKPQNIMVLPGGQVKVMDFGVSEGVRSAVARVTGASPELNPYYAAPEQLLGQELTPASDIYAIGCLFYQLLSGIPPTWQADSQGLYSGEQLKPIPGVARDTNAAILSCLAKDPSRRPPGVANLRAALSRGRDIDLAAEREAAASQLQPETEAEIASAPLPGNSKLLTLLALCARPLRLLLPAQALQGIWSAVWGGLLVLAVIGVLLAMFQTAGPTSPTQATDGTPATAAAGTTAVPVGADPAQKPVDEQLSSTTTFQQSHPVAVRVRNRTPAAVVEIPDKR